MAAKKFVDWAECNGVDISNPIFIKCWSAAIKYSEENFSSHNSTMNAIERIDAWLSAEKLSSEEKINLISGIVADVQQH